MSGSATFVNSVKQKQWLHRSNPAGPHRFDDFAIADRAMAAGVDYAVELGVERRQIGDIVIDLSQMDACVGVHDFP